MYASEAQEILALHQKHVQELELAMKQQRLEREQRERDMFMMRMPSFGGCRMFHPTSKYTSNLLLRSA